MTYTEVTVLRRVEQRQQFAADVIRAAQDRGWTVERDLERDRERSLCLGCPELHVMLWLQPNEVPLLHWHGAARRLAWVSEAWQSVNEYHRHKATSFPSDLEEVIEMMVAGIEAVADGSAWAQEGK